MLKKISFFTLTLLILSLLTSFMLTSLGKYVYNINVYSTEPFSSLAIYYLLLVFIIQIVCCFWIVYIFSNYLLNKKVNTTLVAFITGTGTFIIAELLAYFRFETYFFESFDNFYQVWVFFFTGFLYPFIFNFLKNKIK